MTGRKKLLTWLRDGVVVVAIMLAVPAVLRSPDASTASSAERASAGWAPAAELALRWTGSGDDPFARVVRLPEEQRSSAQAR